MEDRELADKARRGDVAAYEALVHRYQEIAFRTALLVTGDPDEAEEAAQDAFIKAFYALDRFKHGAAFRPWILRIVANEARNQRRAAGRRTRLQLQLAGERAPGDAAPSPEAAALLDEAHRELFDGLSGLSDRDRLVIVYRYFLDMSEAEMAEALDLRRGTVKSRLSRAIARLRKRLTAGPDGKVRTPARRTGEQRG